MIGSRAIWLTAVALTIGGFIAEAFTVSLDREYSTGVAIPAGLGFGLALMWWLPVALIFNAAKRAGWSKYSWTQAAILTVPYIVLLSALLTPGRLDAVPDWIQAVAGWFMITWLTIAIVILVQAWKRGRSVENNLSAHQNGRRNSTNPASGADAAATQE